MLRFEYKYLVPLGLLQKLRGMIQPYMELDDHAVVDGGEYTVRSIYFDTKDLECYYQKLAGVKRRNKVRLRGYNHREDGHLVFFEIKKKVDEPLYKNRAGMAFEHARNILSGAPVGDSIEGTKKTSKAEAIDNVRRFMYHIHARQLHPMVTVIYEREPYQSILPDRENDLRITFDKNLRAVPYPSLDELFEEKISYEVNPHYFIMEVKFNRYLPAWIKAIVASLGLKKGPASKYALSIEACPEILSSSRHQVLIQSQLPLPNFKLASHTNGTASNSKIHENTRDGSMSVMDTQSHEACLKSSSK